MIPILSQINPVTSFQPIPLTLSAGIKSSMYSAKGWILNGPPHCLLVILSSHLHLGHVRNVTPSFLIKVCMHFSCPSHVLHVPTHIHTLLKILLMQNLVTVTLRYRINRYVNPDTWSRAQTQKLLLTEFCPSPSYFLSLNIQIFSSTTCSQISSIYDFPLILKTTFHTHTTFKVIGFVYLYMFRQQTQIQTFLNWVIVSSPTRTCTRVWTCACAHTHTHTDDMGSPLTRPTEPAAHWQHFALHAALCAYRNTWNEIKVCKPFHGKAKIECQSNFENLQVVYLWIHTLQKYYTESRRKGTHAI
jgi:hypothetical protein